MIVSVATQIRKNLSPSSCSACWWSQQAEVCRLPRCGSCLNMVHAFVAVEASEWSAGFVLDAPGPVLVLVLIPLITVKACGVSLLYFVGALLLTEWVLLKLTLALWFGPRPAAVHLAYDRDDPEISVSWLLTWQALVVPRMQPRASYILGRGSRGAMPQPCDTFLVIKHFPRNPLKHAQLKLLQCWWGWRLGCCSLLRWSGSTVKHSH